MKKVNEKGFSLAELLIVVAIIAVMVAIAIPTFGNQLERAREGVDLSAVRNAYSEAVSYFMMEAATKTEATMTSSVDFKQLVSGWTIDTSQFPCKDIQSVFLGNVSVPGTISLTFTKSTDANGEVTIALDSAAVRLVAKDVTEGEGEEATTYPNSKDHPFIIKYAAASTTFDPASIADAVDLENDDDYKLATTPYTETIIGATATTTNVKIGSDGNFARISTDGDGAVTVMTEPTKITVQAKVEDKEDPTKTKTLSCDVWVKVTN